MMLRAVSKIYCESPALKRLVNSRRDVFKSCRTAELSSAAASKTVLTSDSGGGSPAPGPSPAAPAAPAAAPPPPRRPPPRARHIAAAALAVTASLGGAYLMKKLNDDKATLPSEAPVVGAPPHPAPPPAYPPRGADFPPRVRYLIAGGGTAAFAALRAIRSTDPTAQVLVVSEEHALPYMRPPLSKEVWQEAELLAATPPGPAPAGGPCSHDDKVTFKQWNGKRRNLTYEPEAFYTPVEKLASTVTDVEAEGGEGGVGRGRGGVGVARGWRVDKLNVPEHTASLTRLTGEGDGDTVVVKYDKCLIATGSRPRRVEALAAARAAGRSLTLRSISDARALARVVAGAGAGAGAGQGSGRGAGTIVVLGGGFLATELTAALAFKLSGTNKRVVQIFREEAAMAHVLPGYLASDVTDRLTKLDATILTNTEVTGARVERDGLVLELSRSAGAGAGGAGAGAGGAGAELLDAEVVVECVGAEPDTRLAAPSSLEVDQICQGLVVNAELSARSDVYAAGDVAAFYDPLLGRRRLQHHDHAVVSGRLAGENMARGAGQGAGQGAGPARHYTHQSMFWSDLGPELGYEAIGIIDSKLPTVGVFSEEAVTRAEAAAAVGPEGAGAGQGAAGGRYARGVVFYLREQRVVGVLLYNLFNKLHTARQVLAAGEFEDLLEVGKLFTPQVEE